MSVNVTIAGVPFASLCFCLSFLWFLNTVKITLVNWWLADLQYNMSIVQLRQLCWKSLPTSFLPQTWLSSSRPISSMDVHTHLQWLRMLCGFTDSMIQRFTSDLTGHTHFISTRLATSRPLAITHMESDNKQFKFSVHYFFCRNTELFGSKLQLKNAASWSARIR